MKSEKYDFYVAPLTLTVGETDFVDDEILNTKMLVNAINASKAAPKTACPSPDAFYELMEKSDNIIVITISSKLSGTHQSAMAAGADIMLKYPNKKLFIFDSLSACAGQDFIVSRVCEMVESGEYTFDQITEELPKIRKHTRVRFLLHDLGNLIKNGRMNKIVGKILNTAKIKLLCGDDGNGEIKKYGMCLGFKRGIHSLAEYPKRDGVTEEMPIMVSHVYNDTDVDALVSILKNKFGFKNITTRLTRGVSSLYAADKGIVIAY